MIPAIAMTGKSESIFDPGSPLPVYSKIKMSFAEWPEDTTALLKQAPLLTAEQTITELTGIIEDNVDYRDYRKTMRQFLRVLKVNRAFRNKRYKAKLYNDLANISARLKLYPLAMQFCYQEMQVENTEVTMPGEDTNPDNTEDSSYSVSIPAISFSADSTEQNADPGNNESEPVTANEILGSFEDDKEASEYALIVHVKQPVHGKRKAFTGIDNVGHMFITLIKYNTDKSYVVRSFGFYPQKNSFFSATPFHPAAPPVFKDDALHDWDEAVGKFISCKRFVKIIKLLTKYECKMYNLNQNNCTDFGLTIASLSGISILDTNGKWPFGKGNNPANAGQSILEDKIFNESPENKEGIFIFKK